MALNPVYLFRSAGNPGISLPARPLFSGNLTSAVWSCWLHDPNWESAPPQMHNMALDVDDSALAPATWWSFGIVIALGYFVFIYRMFKGKVSLEGSGDHGY